MPFSGYFSHVDTRLNFPVRTTIVSFLFVCIYGLLYLASTTAFNSIVTTNWFSVLWIVILGTTVCMPPNLPVTVGNMNYTSPILVGLFGLIMLAWFMGGKTKFVGPKVDLEFIDTVNQQGMARNRVSRGRRNSM